MKNILLTITFLLGLNAVAQSPGENYVKTKVYKKASTIAIDTLVTIQYMDGLGRPMQTVAVKAGGTGKDIITPVVYDAYGREEKKYLPYVDTGINSPNYRPNTDLVQTADGLGLISSAYVNDYLGELSSTSPNPYSQTKFESSPLNRVLEQGAPGSSWAVSNNPSANHTVKFNYATNKSKELLYFTVAFEQQNNTDKYDSTTLQYNGWYPANELYVTITRDENWSGLENDSNALAKSGVIKEYKDKEGHLILKRVFNTDSNNVTEQLDTYYVYDDYGNLTYVIPPLASSQIVKTVFVRELSLRNYPWTKLTKVDETLADKYEHALNDYKNEDILNVDLQKEYGGSGGFSIYVDEDGNLTMSVNITTDDPMPYRNGAIVSIKEFGEFKDKEIGRISGSDYEYIFLIKDNQIVVVGSGKVPSVSSVLDDSSQLDYSGVFPFTKFVKMDAEEKEKIESKFYELIKAGDTNPEIENSLNAQGIIAVSLTSTDVLSVSINLTAKDFISFESGASFDLPFERRIDDVVLGQSQGYTLRVRNNNLVIEGIGNFINFNFASSTPLTPSVVINSAVAESGLCYIYHYDDRNRLIEKFIPDNGWTQMIYDKLDRLRLSSDQKQQSAKTWMFTKYDCFDRPVYTGKYINLGFSGDRAAMQNYLDSVTILNEVREEGGTFANFDTVNYSNNTFPDWSLIDLVNYNQTPLDVQMVYYYDTYPDYEGVPDYYAPPAINSLGTSLTAKTLGLPTVTQTRVIDQSYWITDVTGYDEKARPIYQYTDNAYLNSKHKVESKLDFLGKPETVITTYQKGTLQSTNTLTWVTTTLRDEFTYDYTGRLLTQFQQVNNNGQFNLIAKNEYDKYGQLLKKYVGGVHTSATFSAPIALQQVDYAYNIRGWLKGINSINGITSSSDDLFAFGINYNQPTHQGGTPLYNGNVSETFWKYKQENNEKAYTYSYDGLNRLTNALYKEMTVNNQRYYEGPIHYDKNGNIMDLERFGFDSADNTYKIIDQLSYHYNPLSNRLAKVDDTAGTTGFKDVNNNGADDYAYDLNGNMVNDVNKGITEITYNHLNLPVKITFTGLQKNIEYVYSAAGRKLSKKVTNGRAITTTLYDNGFVYENNVLKFFPHPEGYVDCENSNFTYVYQYKDHLGNVRLSYKGTHGNLTVEEKNDYYAFGLKHGIQDEVVNSTNIALKYKYNGKELQDELGLNMYDYGARNYDPALGRWMNIDPMTMIYPSYSPYNYCMNNPVIFNDPNGMDVKNGFEDEYNDALGKMNTTQIDYDEALKNGNKKQINQARKAHNSAEKRFNKIKGFYDATNKVIEELKKKAPKLYQLVDDLQDGGGNKVDVIVRAADSYDFQTMEGNTDVEKMLGMGTEGEGIILAEKPKGSRVQAGKSGKPYLKVGSYDRMGFKGDGANKVSVYMRIGQEAEWLAHEFGHALYLVPNLYEYYNWVIQQGNNYQQGQHGEGDPSGKSADDTQKKYNNGDYK